MREKQNLNGFFIKSFYLLVLLCTFLYTGTAFSQKLNTDTEVPELDILGAEKTFSVLINKGALDCPTAKLKMELPPGIQYIPNSIKIDGQVVSGELVNQQMVEVNVPVIPGPQTSSVLVEFNLRALCEANDLKIEDRIIHYEFSDCGDTQKGTSNTINLRYAKLNIELSQKESSGLIGESIFQEIKIINSGNAPISQIYVPVSYGQGIERRPSTLTGNWKEVPGFDPKKGGMYVYEGTILSGGSISFKEELLINSCLNLNANYNAYYKDTNECELGSAVLTSFNIVIDPSRKPNLKITKIKNSSDVSDCFDENVKHSFILKNIGNATASQIELFIGANGSSTINSSSITADGMVDFYLQLTGISLLL